MSRIFCLVVVALTFTGSAWMALVRYQSSRPALLDFAAMIRSPNLQSGGSVRASMPVPGLAIPLPAIRPPFYRILIPHDPAWWLALNVACGLAIACWIVLRRDRALAVLWAIFPPAIISLFVGQDSLILVGVLLAVFLLLEDKPFLAGFLLAILWTKFQFLPAFLLLLIVRRQWTALAGFSVASVALWMPVAAQIPSYVATLQRSFADPAVVPCRECMPCLHALIPSFAWAAVASVTVLMATAWIIRNQPLAQAFAITLAAAVLSGMHAHVYDAVFLFLAVVLVKWKTPALWIAAWTLSPVPYLLPYVSTRTHLAPALTALSLWIALGIALISRRRLNPAPAGSSPVLDEYRKA